MSERKAVAEQKELARVESIFIGFEDRHIFTVQLMLEFESGGIQGFGGLALSYENEARGVVGKQMSGDFIVQLLEVFEAKDTYSLKHKVCYAINTGYNTPIIGIESVNFGGGQKKTFRIEEWQKFWEREVARGILR